MQKMTEQYNLVDVVLNPTAAMDTYKKLCQYEESGLDPAEVRKLKRRIEILRKLLNSLRKEMETAIGYNRRNS